MTLRRFPLSLVRRARSLLPWQRGVVGASLIASLLFGCSGQSGQLGSTDTGNPPVVIGQKLRLAPSNAGVVVSGEPGAVPGGARVDVINLSTGRSEATTAAADGSFELEIEGSLDDEYRVHAALDGQSSRASLSAAGASDTEVGLAGLVFVLDSAEGYVPVEGTTISLRFEASEFGFDAGCNGHFGPYSLCDGRLCSTGLGATEIGCDQERQAQDEWLAAFFTSSPALTQEGARLELENAEARLEFLDREVANPDRPLTGRTWTIDTFIDGGGASNFPLQAPPTIVFGDDGSFGVQTTCNVGDGRFTAGDGTLVLSDVGYTEEVCDPSGSPTARDHITSVLTDGTLSFEIDAARLTIQRGTLGLSATTE